MPAIISAICRPSFTKRCDALLKPLGACCNRIKRYFDHRAAIASLLELDAAALQDIGLERSQIAAAVHGQVRPDPCKEMATAFPGAIGPRKFEYQCASNMEALTWN